MISSFTMWFTGQAHMTIEFNELFRYTFPEFIDTAKFPDQRIVFFAGLAKILMDKTVWGDLYDYGLYLFIAHNLIVDNQRQTYSKSGAFTGFGPIALSSRSVDGVSYTNKFMMGFYRNAGFWATTTYGQQYYDYINLVGVRPVQLW